MMKKIAATLLCAAAPGALLAQQVDLRSPDEFISVEGEIVGFNGVMLRVETTVGTVSVPASEVICYGAGCLEVLASNDFGLTADALGGVEANRVAETTTAPAPLQGDLSVAFDSPAFSAFVTSLAGVSGAQVSGSNVVLNDGSNLVLSNSADADVTIGAVALEGAQPSAFAAPAGWASASAGMTHQLIGLNGFSVQIAPNAGLDRISMNDLARVFAGEVTNWSEIGGANLAVLALRLPDNSPIYREMNAVLMEPAGLTVSSGVLAMGDEAGITASVNQFPGSISIVTSANANDALTIPVSGNCGQAVAPTPFNILSGDYPLVRPVMASYGGAASGAVTAFFDAAASDAGQQVGASLGMLDYSATAQDAGINSARLSGLLNAEVDDNQRNAAAAMFQSLFGATRLSTTLHGGAVSGPEAAWNRAMMVDLVEYLSQPANAGREVIFVGIGESDAGTAAAIELSAAAASAMQSAFQASASDLVSSAGLTLSSFGFGDVAKTTCVDSQVSEGEATRVEIWIR